MLAGNSLSGPVPAALGDLSSLEVLNLANNDLSGPIPAALGDLSSLQVLDLAHNDLSGPIPARLGDLSSLQWLSVSGNDLSGPVPAVLGQLGDLVSLNLSDNDLSGLIPAALADPVGLRSLFLTNNAFAWPAPGVLSSPRERLRVSLPRELKWAPAVPGGVSALPRVDALAVSWDAPVSGAPVVSGYVVSYRRADGSRWSRVETTQRSLTLEGLAAGVSYEVVVTGSNHNGAGAVSEAVTAAPLESPCGLSAVVDQAQTALVADCGALWSQRRALTDAAALVGAGAGAGAWGDTAALDTWRGVNGHRGPCQPAGPVGSGSQRRCRSAARAVGGAGGAGPL